MTLPEDAWERHSFGFSTNISELLIYHIDSVLGIGYNESVGEIFLPNQGPEGGWTGRFYYFLPSGGMEGETWNLLKL